MGFEVHVVGNKNERVWLGVKAAVVLIEVLWMEQYLGAAVVEVEEVNVPHFYRANIQSALNPNI